jgi:hypothetical protein
MLAIVTSIKQATANRTTPDKKHNNTANQKAKKNPFE